MDRIVESMFEKVRRVEELLSNGNVLNEINLSRVWQLVTGGANFVMISLSRSTMEEKMKPRAFNYLKNQVKGKGYGFVELRGGYVEKDENGKIINQVVDESSLMVTLKKSSSDEDRLKFLKDMMEIAKIDYSKDVEGEEPHGSQHSILYCNGEDFVGYIVTGDEPNTRRKTLTFGNDKITVDITSPYFDYDEIKNEGFTQAIDMYFSLLVKGSHKNRMFAFKPKPDEKENNDGKKVNENFFLYEMWDKRYPRKTDKDWWYNFGYRIL
jgi:hypothetical protein